MQTDPGNELECLIDDVAAGGADGVGGAPGDAAPHPGGQAGQAGGRAERGLEAADTETGELVSLVSGSSVDHIRSQGAHREVVHSLRRQQLNLT